MADRHEGEGRAKSPRRTRDGINAAEAGRLGLSQVSELTGKEAEAITGVEPADDGWLVMVEMVEERRIPSSGDILATYEAELSLDGDLLSYRRDRRYARGHGDGG